MKIFAVAMLLAGSVWAVPSALRTSSFEPCRWWRYDSQSGTHTCQSTDRRLSVYEAREVDQLIRTLENRIRTLETRVQKLEQGR